MHQPGFQLRRLPLRRYGDQPNSHRDRIDQVVIRTRAHPAADYFLRPPQGPQDLLQQDQDPLPQVLPVRAGSDRAHVQETRVPAGGSGGQPDHRCRALPLLRHQGVPAHEAEGPVAGAGRVRLCAGLPRDDQRTGEIIRAEKRGEHATAEGHPGPAEEALPRPAGRVRQVRKAAHEPKGRLAHKHPQAVR